MSPRNRGGLRCAPPALQASRTLAVIYAPEGLDEGIAALAGEPVFRAILDRAGAPRFRRRRNGFPTLLHIILEQQVSIDAAAAMHRRLAGLVPAARTRRRSSRSTTTRCAAAASAGRRWAMPAAWPRRSPAAGSISRRSPPTPDDEARAALVALKGIGRWSAEIYLIFALGRADVWPAADLGLQLAVAECLGLDERPKEPALREMGEQMAAVAHGRRLPVLAILSAQAQPRRPDPGAGAVRRGMKLQIPGDRIPSAEFEGEGRWEGTGASAIARAAPANSIPTPAAWKRSLSLIAERVRSPVRCRRRGRRPRNRGPAPADGRNARSARRPSRRAGRTRRRYTSGRRTPCRPASRSHRPSRSRAARMRSSITSITRCALSRMPAGDWSPYRTMRSA